MLGGGELRDGLADGCPAPSTLPRYPRPDFRDGLPTFDARERGETPQQKVE